MSHKFFYNKLVRFFYVLKATNNLLLVMIHFISVLGTRAVVEREDIH